MSGWRVELTRPAQRDLRRLDPQVERRVRAALRRLHADPRAGDVRKLTGPSGQWRLRVGDWRVRFTRDESKKVISVLRVLPRGGAYRD
ncbi:MAG: type II toxin-antitoxin system RelE family toxin [Thermoleophilaceae bacterium]